MHQPMAVSDQSLDRLAATTEDRFVRDTIVAVRRRQFSYHAYYRARAEEDRHAPAINQEHARLIAEHQEATRRRWWQWRSPETPKPAWEDAAEKVIERDLPRLRGLIEETCEGVRQRLAEGARLIARTPGAGRGRGAGPGSPRPGPHGKPAAGP